MIKQKRVCPVCKVEIPGNVFIAHVRRHFLKDACDDVTLDKLASECILGKEEAERIVKEYRDGLIAFYEVPSVLQTYIRKAGWKRTSKEERQTQRYKDKYLASIRAKYGEGITNISQVKEVQKKKEESYAKKFGSYEAYLQDFRSKGEKARDAFFCGLGKS